MRKTETREAELRELLELVLDTYQSKNLKQNWGVESLDDVAGIHESGQSLSAMGMAVHKARQFLAKLNKVIR